MSCGTTSEAAVLSAPIVRRADYVSGRDERSVETLSELLRVLDDARLAPGQVQSVRDPVLSDNFYTDTNGYCWKQNLGERHSEPKSDCQGWKHGSLVSRGTRDPGARLQSPPSCLRGTDLRIWVETFRGSTRRRKRAASLGLRFESVEKMTLELRQRGVKLRGPPAMS